jgi:hypothetical protein
MVLMVILGSILDGVDGARNWNECALRGMKAGKFAIFSRTTCSLVSLLKTLWKPFPF